MSDVWVDQEETGSASIEAFVMMYGRKKNYILGEITWVKHIGRFTGRNFDFLKISAQNCCFLLFQKRRRSTQAENIEQMHAKMQ